MLLSFNRRLMGFLLASLAICVTVTGLLLAFVGSHGDTNALPAPLPPLSLLAVTPIAPSPPTPVLTVTRKPPQIDAKAVYLLDADTGNTLDDWHGELPLPMASTTKIMTALLAIQSGQLNQLVTVHQDAIDEITRNMGASSAGLHVGERFPLGELLYGLMLPSGNDAAIAIADAVGGSCSNFVHMMNVEASHLHLFSTNYTSPDGLISCVVGSTGHYTTAYDLALLARYAMRLPLFAKIVSTPAYALAPRTSLHPASTWTNTNDLLGDNPTAYPGATGIKTGHTDQAGECLVFSATRSNHHLIGILLYDTKADPNQRFQDARTLLDWGFTLPVKLPIV